MGCGASNSAAVTTPTASTPNRNQSRNASNRPPAMASLPLVKAKNFRHGTTITSGELNNLRSDFWGSRTEGNTNMWLAIRSAADAMLGDDLALANAIVEASNIITPNGSLELCYDERGFQYKVPQYCYANPLELTNEPTTIIPDNVSERSKNKANSELSAPTYTESGVSVKLRMRINPGDHNLAVAIDNNATIEHLKLMVVKEVNERIPSIQNMNVQRQRIIFMGKELTNNVKVKDAKFDDSKVVQVFLRPVA